MNTYIYPKHCAKHNRDKPKYRHYSTSVIYKLVGAIKWYKNDTEICEIYKQKPEKLYVGQETVKTEQGTMNWHQKSGKVYIKAVCGHPADLIYMQSTSHEMPGWVKHKLESRLPGEISITWYADDTTLMVESEEELKSLLIRVKKLA